MPLFQFLCKKCNEASEILVRGSEHPVCPACGSAQLEKQMSHIMPMQRGAAAGPACGSCCAAEPGGSCGLDGACGFN